MPRTGSSSPRRWFTVALLVALGTAVACGKDHAADTVTARAAPRGPNTGAGSTGVGGTVVIATGADAETLFPPLVQGLTARQVIDLVFEPLAELGADLNTVGDAGFRPRLAREWRWAPDSLSIAFALDPRARWHDGAPVTAEDVRFTFAVYRDSAVASPAAADVAGVDSVTAPDARTAVFWFARRSSEQFYTAAARLRIVPAHLLAGVPRADFAAAPFARHPVGSGRFRFARWDPQRRLELVADSTHPLGRPRLDRVVWLVAPSPPAAFNLLLSGAADVLEAVRPEQLAAVARRPELTTIAYPGLQYGFLVFNLRGGEAPPRGGRGAEPLFAERALRRALALALDRPAMVRNVFDTLARVPVGPFARAQPLVDTAARQLLPPDPAAARRALDALGWRAAAAPTSDGVAPAARSRGGRPLAFSVIVPRSSEARTRLAVLVQEQLRQVGVAARVEPLEFPAFLDRLARRRFDAAVNMWTLDSPSPWGVRELWGSEAARAVGGPNHAGYASAAFDAAVDSARDARGAADARRLLAGAQRVINDDAPAVWLFEPRPVLAVHRRLRVTGVRADAWWAGLAEWGIAPGEAIARDGMGRRGVTGVVR